MILDPSTSATYKIMENLELLMKTKITKVESTKTIQTLSDTISGSQDLKRKLQRIIINVVIPI